MRSLRLLPFALVAAGLLVPAAAAAQAPNGPLTLAPSSGPLGTSFTATQTVSTPCTQWWVAWDDPGITSSRLAGAGGTATYTVGLTVPAGATFGDHVVTSYCQAAGTVAAPTARAVGRATFTVTRPPTTTTTTTTAPTTTTTTTTAPPATTTTTAPPPATTTTTAPPPTTATTRPRPTTTTSTTTTTTAPPGPGPTPTTSAPPTTATTVVADGGSGLLLDQPSVPPGATVRADGHGCDPGAPVALSIGGTPAGTSEADEAGTFSDDVVLTTQVPGSYVVVARCGPRLEAPLDVVLVSHADAGASSAVVLLFVVLCVVALARLTRHVRGGTR
jgi:hypothetical protein